MKDNNFWSHAVRSCCKKTASLLTLSTLVTAIACEADSYENIRNRIVTAIGVENERWYTEEAMMLAHSLDGSSVSALRRLLKDEDPRIRELAADALGNIGEGAESAAKDLIGLFNDERSSVVKSAIAAAANVVNIRSDYEATDDVRQSPLVEVVREELMKKLENSEPGIRTITIGSCVKLAERGDPSFLHLLSVAYKDAVPVLLHTINHSSNLRNDAFLVLQSIARSHPEAICELVKLVNNSDHDISELAVETIVGIGAGAHVAAPVFIDNITQGRYGTDWSYIEALGEIKPSTPEAILTLSKLVKNNNVSPSIQEAAVSSLEKIGQGAVAAIPALVEALFNPRLNAYRTCNALAAIGPHPKSEIPKLFVEALLSATKEQLAARDSHDVLQVELAIKCMKDKYPSLPAILQENKSKFSKDVKRIVEYAIY